MTDGTYSESGALLPGKRIPSPVDLDWIRATTRLARALSPVEKDELQRLRLPSSKDYSKFVTLVYDQVGGGCGGATDLGILNILKEMECPYTPDLSLRFLNYVYNDSSFFHQDPRIQRAGLDQSGTLVYYGCCSEASWPFADVPYPDSVQPPDDVLAEAQQYRLALIDPESANPGCGPAISNPDPVTIKQMLFKYGPLVALSDTHVFAIVGYDDSSGDFTLLNSWGDWWGTNGMLKVPYGKIANPLGADHTFDVKVVRYLKSELGTVGPRFTGRIRVRHETGRGHLQVRAWAEGQAPLVVWKPRAKDSCKDLCLDFPLPPYAEQFWPPKDGRRWYVEVSDSSHGLPTDSAAVVDEVTLVERVRLTQGRWLPILYRPSSHGFSVPHGGSVTIYVPTCKTYQLTLTASPSIVSKGDKVRLGVGLAAHFEMSSDFHPAQPLPNQRIQLFKITTDPIEQTILKKLVGECVTSSSGTCTLEDSPQTNASYQAFATRSDQSVIASSNVASVRLIKHPVPPHELHA